MDIVDVRDRIRQALRQDQLDKGKWRHLWLDVLALGSPESKAARTSSWVMGALSDFRPAARRLTRMCSGAPAR